MSTAGAHRPGANQPAHSFVARVAGSTGTSVTLCVGGREKYIALALEKPHCVSWDWIMTQMSERVI